MRQTPWTQTGLFRRHATAIAAFVGLYAALNLASVAPQLPRLLGLLKVFDLNGEHNVPALFSWPLP